MGTFGTAVGRGGGDGGGMIDQNNKYCLLPGGNANEIPVLIKELKSRQIEFQVFFELRDNFSGFLFQIPNTELSKLPSDKKGPYLGDDESGHSIYNLDIETVKKMVNINQ